MPGKLPEKFEKVWSEAYDKALKEYADEEKAAKVAMTAIKKAGYKMDASPKVFRWDRGSYKKPIKMDNGWLKVDANLTRTGILTYRNSDGSVRRELRLPEEVFKQDSLETLHLVPLTNRHPPEPLDASNTKQYSVGTVGSDARQDTSFVRATLLVTDAVAVGEAESGSARELSCGYICELESAPGMWEGQRYDAVQKNIRYNHVALEPMGRAGPAVRIHMDATDAIEVGSEDTITFKKEGPVMAKIRLDKVEYEVTDQVAQAIGALQEKQDAEVKAYAKELSEVKASVDKIQAKADALETEKTALEKERNDAVDSTRIQEAVNARVGLEKQAVVFLGEEKMDGLTDTEIKSKVILKTSPEAKLEGKSEEYIQARYDHVIETTEKRNDALGDVRIVANQAATAPRMDAETARIKMMAEDDKRWQSTFDGRGE